MKKYQIVLNTNIGIPVTFIDEFESIELAYAWAKEFVKKTDGIQHVASVEAIIPKPFPTF